MVIVTHKDLEKIGEAGRFKKRESSKDFAESLASKMYTSKDPGRRFISLSIIVD